MKPEKLISAALSLGRKSTQHPRLKSGTTGRRGPVRILPQSPGFDATAPFTDLANRTLVPCSVRISNSRRGDSTPRAHPVHASVTFADVVEVVSVLHPNRASSEGNLSSGLAESLTNNLLPPTGTSPGALCPQTCARRAALQRSEGAVVLLNTSLYQNTRLLAYIDTSVCK